MSNPLSDRPQPPEFNQAEFNAAILIAMDKMGKVVVPIHEELAASRTYQPYYVENADFLVWFADITRAWRTKLLESTERDKLRPDFIAELDKL